MAVFPKTNLSMQYVCFHFGYWRARLSTLCRHPNINPFSKWKPVSYDATSIDLAKLKSIKYGITMTRANNIKALIDAIDANGTQQYKRPLGNSKSPFRLGDFRNYDPDASLPSWPMGERTIDNAGAAVTGIASINNGDGTDTEIGFNELYDEVDTTGQKVKLYHGIFMRNENGDELWCTDNIEWEKIIVNRPNWIKKTDVTVYDFWCNFKKAINETHVGDAKDIFLANPSNPQNPIPYTWHLTGEKPAGSEFYFFTLKALIKESNKDYVNYTIKMSSIGDVYYGGTARNISLQLRDKPDYTEGQIVGSVQIGNYTIGQEEEKTWTGDILYFDAPGMTTIWAFLFADNVLQDKTAVLKPA